jgi:hypothetical protein
MNEFGSGAGGRGVWGLGGAVGAVVIGTWY